MGKKKKNKKNAKPQPVQERDYYQLHTEAIDKLVNANKSKESAGEEKVTEEAEEITLERKIEARKYQKNFLSRVPVWIKAIFIKYWFCGIVCFFFYVGLSYYITNSLDRLFVLALASGIFTDIIVNNVLRFLNSDKKEYNGYMMFPQKKYWTFFTNILYSFVMITCVYFTYTLVNLWILGGQTGGEVPWEVEPFGFAAVYLFYDLIFLFVRNAISSAIAKTKQGMGSQDNGQTENIKRENIERDKKNRTDDEGEIK